MAVFRNRPAASRVQAQSLAPRFGENYKAGYIGFTQARAGAPAQGISHFTRWSRLGDIHVSHVFVVTGENECVEALPGKGVVQTSLGKYFDDARTHVFFRKPRKCTGGLGGRIAETALAQAGTKYEQLLLAAQVLDASFLRRWVNSAFSETPERFLGKMLNRDARWIAGEFAAYCLDCQPEYADKGLLSVPHDAVDPQELFEDEEIFAAWKNSAIEEEPGVDVTEL